MKLPRKILLNALYWFSFAALTLFPTLNNAQAQSRGFAIQIASASSETEARNLIASLKSKGVDAYMVKSDVAGKGTRYRVRVGKFGTQQQAKASGHRLISSNAIREFIVMAYESPADPIAASRESKPKPADQTVARKPKATKANAADSDLAQAEKHKGFEKSAAAVKPIAATPTNQNNPEPATSPAETETQVNVESKAVSAPVAKLESKTEAKRERVVETVPTENKSAEPVTADANPEPGGKADPLNAEPKIVTAPVADILAEAAYGKSNWRVVRRNAETDKNLRAIHFVDSMTGWAAGDAGAVYRTTDGGRSWKPLLSGVTANINFVHFLNWNHGWMIGESTAKDDDGGESVLLGTINGGRTWMIQKIPNLLGVHFTDLQNGWAVGRNATLLRTTNGGTDWKPVAEIQSLVGLPVESSNYNFGFRDVFFLDADHGWLIGNFYGRAQNNIGGLYVTADGGKTWKRIPLTLQTKYVSGRFTPGLLHSVRFTDPETGTVTGEMKDGENRFFFALHTRDGGKTWEQHRTPIRATHSAQFLDPSNGWMAAFAPREGSAEAIVYDTTLMRTDNGGQSWQNDFTAKGSRIRSLFFLNTNKGWAVGDRGMILRYEEKTKAMN